MDRAARRMGLEINQAKTKYMICGTKKKYVENVLKVKHMTFERVNSFVYLGTLTLRSLTLYIYGAPILDVSRSHTTTQHSR